MKLTNLAILVLAGLLALPASAQLVCTAAGLEISATVNSSTSLANVIVKYDSERVDYGDISGRSDPWKMSPQEGMRFYLHSGNTSTFLLFQEDFSSNFAGQYISESYEEPGAGQDITPLSCELRD